MSYWQYEAAKQALFEQQLRDSNREYRDESVVEQRGWLARIIGVLRRERTESQVLCTPELSNQRKYQA